MTDPITKFQGPTRWLSNFWPAQVFDAAGYEYPTTEHAYQAAKTLDPQERKQIRKARTPGEAWRLGRKVTMRPDWDDVKLDIMVNLQRQKFLGFCANPEEARKLIDTFDAELIEGNTWGDTFWAETARKLIDTGDAELIEGNTWGDTFWGVCDGVGENHLGRIIMKIRELLLPP